MVIDILLTLNLDVIDRVLKGSQVRDTFSTLTHTVPSWCVNRSDHNVVHLHSLRPLVEALLVLGVLHSVSSSL